MKILKFLRKWYVNSLPLSFPPDCDSLEKLIYWGKQNRIDAFNGQFIRAFILWKLFEHFSCTSFVETGTFYGYTTGFVARVFKTSVFSCEINKSNYLISKVFLIFTKNTHLSYANSPDFLRHISNKEIIGTNPMFYLDAHWGSYFPLPEELNIILKQCSKTVVATDDFCVSPDSWFGYDEYDGVRIDTNLLRQVLRSKLEQIKMYYPEYDPQKEIGGKRRGAGIILLGQEKDMPKTFPFDLLTKAK